MVKSLDDEKDIMNKEYYVNC